MATLRDLTKEQLIELIGDYTKTIQKQLEVIDYFMEQIQEAPNEQRITIECPLRTVSNEQLQLTLLNMKADYLIAKASPDSKLLFEFMKARFASNIYTI